MRHREHRQPQFAQGRFPLRNAGALGVEPEAAQHDLAGLLGEADAAPVVVDEGHLASAAILVEIEGEGTLAVRAAGVAAVGLVARHGQRRFAGLAQLFLPEDRQAPEIGELERGGIEAAAQRLLDQLAIERAQGVGAADNGAQRGEMLLGGIGGVGTGQRDALAPLAIIAAEFQPGRHQRYQRSERAPHHFGAPHIGAARHIHQAHFSSPPALRAASIRSILRSPTSALRAALLGPMSRSPTRRYAPHRSGPSQAIP